MTHADRTVRQITRRDVLRQGLALAAAAACEPVRIAWAGEPAEEQAPIALGSRRELFVDDFLIASLAGAELKLHKPEPRDVALVCDQPWEGNTSAYFTLFRDDDRFRVYYRGSHFDEKTKKAAHPEFTCYAESRDGLKWEKPELGLFEFNGSKQNNIVWAGPGTHNFTPFKDDNPACAARRPLQGAGRRHDHGQRQEAAAA